MRPLECVVRANCINIRLGAIAVGVQQLDYPQMITRRVNKNGKINWANNQLFVTSSLAGWSVGLQPTDQDQLEVWFARLLLGWIDPQTASFRRADILPKTAF